MANIEFDKPVEHCGVVGLISTDGADVVRMGTVMSNDLQHRGFDSAGSLAVKDGDFRQLKGLGRIKQIFSERRLTEYGLSGDQAIFHNRYILQGDGTYDFAQPLIAEYGDRKIGVAHNGNIPDLLVLNWKLLSKKDVIGPYFDSNLLAHAIVSAEGVDWVERVQNGLQGVEGSYSLAILTNDGHLLAVRDPWGNRPLSWGIFNNGFAVASETVAFDAVGAQVMGEVRPGEILDFSTQGFRRSWLLEEAEEARCVFEKIYFGFETSRDDGELHSDFRKRLGRIAGEEANLNEGVRGDLVSDVPESSTVAALEYAKVRSLEYQRLILKKKASFARSFMGADKEKREELGEGKYTISPDVADQELEIVDDSAVRGTTSRVLIKNLRRMGAKRVKLVFTSPKVINDCRYGVDMNNSTGAFVARNQETGEIRSDEQIATTVGADEVQYMRLDQLRDAVDMGRGESKNYCMECFGGRGLGSLRYRSAEKPQMARAGELIQIG